MNGDGDEGGWRIAADTGGTFTDVVGVGPGGIRREAKVLSTGVLRLACREWIDGRTVRLGPDGPPDGFMAGCRGDRGGRVAAHGEGVLRFDEDFPGRPAALEFATGLPAPVLGAHWVTGTPLGAELPPLRLRIATTRGTNALLEGKGAEVTLFVSEGFEDLLAIGDQTRPDLFARPIVKRPSLVARSVGLPVRFDRRGAEVTGGGGSAAAPAGPAPAPEPGRVAVLSLCNGYRNPAREREWAERLRAAGWERVVAASEVSALPGYLRRTETAVVEGCLGPILDRYLDGVAATRGVRGIDVMTSSGGIVPRERFRAVDSLLSGPAGGVVGAGIAARSAGLDSFLAFDMGGTSTDVSRFDGGAAYRGELSVGPARVFAEALRIDTVAAGGGSVCGFDGFGFTVGPGSAGADPGPACYGRGGPLTLTDIHLLLGRIDPGRFRVPVDRPAAEAAFADVLRRAGRSGGRAEERRGILEGFLSIANERMAGALRGLSVREGLDPARFALLSFGGAGGLHACPLAGILGIGTILQPGAAGILSAEGLAEARPERVVRRAVQIPLEDFRTAGAGIFARAERELLGGPEDGTAGAPMEIRREAFVRVIGQEATLACDWEPGSDLREAFHRRFEQVFGFRREGLPLEVASIRLRARPRAEPVRPERFPAGGREHAPGGAFLDGGALAPGDRGGGPRVIVQRFGTLAVEEGWSFRVGDRGSVLLERTGGNGPRPAGAPAAVEVGHELFRNRFGGIVGAMGGTLRRTALSVNIRERLDFSCALLDGAGRLVVNAPHIPVHLGALGHCVRSVSEVLDWRPGDIALTNHPAFGGSHLPDVTVIAPVFAGGDTPAVFLAVRAHHAEIGGIRPGSMPADARSLDEEGVVLPPFHLFREGENRMGVLERLLRGEDGGRFRSRAPETNLADVLSQVAALREGRAAVEQLFREAGPAVVARFAGRILRQSREWMGAAVRRLPAGAFGGPVEVRMDGGGRIRVAGRRTRDGRLGLDFTGTDPPGDGSFQCPCGVTLSAVLYACRLLADRDLPLNEGLLEVVDLRVPPGCLLAAEFPGADPARQPPVVAGNVEVSQRVVGALLRLFGLEADSQGTMNNVVFGNGSFSHYETIGGGSGGSAKGPGADAVQVHMTNTAITDPEVIEHRFPVRIARFAVRAGSGGRGRFRGGDGIVREYVFEEGVDLSVLSQHRSAGPAGAHGGGAGLPGRQTVTLPDGTQEDLPHARTLALPAGSRLRVETPGGGGWGRHR
ncbi:MAG: hydantoinase B/oxoprolinase family protein [Puniceicoccaceae bacterium]